MSEWKVIKTQAEVLNHPNADALDIVRADEFQLVTQKGLYKTGDTIIIVPDKSVLTNGTMLESFGKYLRGKDKNRVATANMRGEVSQGVTWPITELDTFGKDNKNAILNASIGDDISTFMGISKYIPPIPAQLSGQVRGIHLTGKKGEFHHQIYNHDCYQFGAFARKYFNEDTRICVTEKVHGSLCSYTALFELGDLVKEVVSSKGLLKQGIEILEDDVNSYWKAVRNTNLRKAATDTFQEFVEQTGIEEAVITITGELIPVQNGFSYGEDTNKPVIKVFSLMVNDVHVPLRHVLPELAQHWVPVLYNGTLKDFNPYDFGDGMENVSGKKLHIMEGYVVSDEDLLTMLPGNENRPVYLKVINPKYSKKESGEEIS